MSTIADLEATRRRLNAEDYIAATKRRDRESCARIVQRHQRERGEWTEMADRLPVVRRVEGGEGA